MRSNDQNLLKMFFLAWYSSFVESVLWLFCLKTMIVYGDFITTEREQLKKIRFFWMLLVLCTKKNPVLQSSFWNQMFGAFAFPFAI